MNKSIFAAALGALALISSSPAAVYTDVHDAATFMAEFGDDKVLLRANGNPRSSYTNTFNIVDDGYVPGSGLSSATVTFWVHDQTRHELADEIASVVLDGEWFSNSPSNLPFANVAFGGNLGLNLLLALEANGTLSYTVTAVSGSLFLKRAELTAVPDAGSTIMLLGLGLLGIIAARRRVQSV